MLHGTLIFEVEQGFGNCPFSIRQILKSRFPVIYDMCAAERAISQTSEKSEGCKDFKDSSQS